MASIIERNSEVNVGNILLNRNGVKYRVLHSTNRDGETTVMSMTSTPWVCVAHNIDTYDDGTIEWESSTGIGFLQDIQSRLEQALEDGSCRIDCQCHIAEARDVVGGLHQYCFPWWEEEDVDPAGWVSFEDHDGKVWSTDGNQIVFHG